MAPSLVHLPNGHTLTVTPVFGGLFFRSNNLSPHHNVFPPGWTIVINCEDDEDDDEPAPTLQPAGSDPDSRLSANPPKKHFIHRFRKPSLRSDHLFISSISNPATHDFRPATSQTRSIAMMLWATLWWYFHQPVPEGAGATHSGESHSSHHKGDWRVNINREGIFTGKHLLPKLERMGLIASEDSSVGLDPDDGVKKSGEGWTKMFVSRRTFWQLDPRIYLFSLSPATQPSPYPSASPATSRPASPDRRPNAARSATDETPASQFGTAGGSGSLAMPPHLTRNTTPPGPFTSNSHLPTFYPAPPPQYIYTKGIRHPVRPKPPRQGETFYTRYIPSLGEYLNFRVASLSSKPCTHFGPTMTTPLPGTAVDINSRLASHADGGASSDCLTDLELLHKWMNIPRVNDPWGEGGPIEHQRAFLERGLTSKNSFPVIGCFDGRPFGYFEIYWVREDVLGVQLKGSGREDSVHDYDRGVHCLVGEQAFRGPERVRVWLSALVHYCWLADARTNTIMMEPRVDNTKLLKYCEDVGFHKDGEVSFSHKRSNLVKIKRETWDAPAI